MKCQMRFDSELLKQTGKSGENLRGNLLITRIDRQRWMSPAGSPRPTATQRLPRGVGYPRIAPRFDREFYRKPKLGGSIQHLLFMNRPSALRAEP